jgi:phosphoribosylanthranilate isomerase
LGGLKGGVARAVLGNLGYCRLGRSGRLAGRSETSTAQKTGSFMIVNHLTEHYMRKLAVEITADIVQLSGKNSESEIAELLFFEIMGVLRVHNDNVRVTISELLKVEAGKLHDRHKDDPFEEAGYRALYDAMFMVTHVPLPFDDTDSIKKPNLN